MVKIADKLRSASSINRIHLIKICKLLALDLRLCVSIKTFSFLWASRWRHWTIMRLKMIELSARSVAFCLSGDECFCWYFIGFFLFVGNKQSTLYKLAKFHEQSYYKGTFVLFYTSRISRNRLFGATWSAYSKAFIEIARLLHFN